MSHGQPLHRRDANTQACERSWTSSDGKHVDVLQPHVTRREEPHDVGWQAFAVRARRVAGFHGYERVTIDERDASATGRRVEGKDPHVE